MHFPGPHRVCLANNPWLVWPSVLFDLLTSVAYLAIPFAIWRSGRGGAGLLPAPWMTWLFVAFIVCCGLTHALGAVTIFVPWYGTANVVKGITATISLVTAWRLVRALPAIESWVAERERLAQAMAATVAPDGSNVARLNAAVERLREAAARLERR